jgi:hypothetical protein
VFLSLLLRALLIGVFALAVFAKTATRSARRTLLTSIADAHIVPRKAATPAAALLVTAEAASLALLVPDRLAPWGFASAAVTMALLTAAVAVVVSTHRVVPCACFGSTGQPLSGAHVFRNAVLFALATLGVLNEVGAAPDGTLDTGSTVLAIGLGALVALVFVRWDDIAAAVLRGARSA